MANKVNYAVGIDAGASRTRCLICSVEGGRIRLLGAAEAECRSWAKSRVADQQALTESLLAAVGEAERQAQVSVESAVVGMGGPAVRGANSRSSIRLGRPREIVTGDVRRVLDQAARVQLAEDRMVLQMFPQDFVVDDHPGHRDPRKMLAYDLEANVHMITASLQEHATIVAAVNQAHLSVDETVFEPIAAAFASVLPEERREGIAIIDIGAQSVGLAVYYGDALQLATGLAVSGDHFTRDLARGLCVGFDEAELIKHEYGCAIAAATARSALIEVPSPADREPREASRRFVSEILEPRAEELFRHARKELVRVGMERALLGGVVLVGGGSKLPGMCDMAERALNCQARKGWAIGIQDWPDEFDDPTWATAAGLAMYSGRLKLQGTVERQSIGVLGKILR